MQVPAFVRVKPAGHSLQHSRLTIELLDGALVLLFVPFSGTRLPKVGKGRQNGLTVFAADAAAAV